MDIRNDLVQAEENLLTKENIQNASALLSLLHGKVIAFVDCSRRKSLLISPH